jgi:septum formation protein
LAAGTYLHSLQILQVFLTIERVLLMNPETELVLASGSPRRSELVNLAGLPFTVRPGNLDEHQLPGEEPAAYVLRMAKIKAQHAAAQVAPGSFVLAADTIVVHRDDVLGKPASPAEAADTLRRLRGQIHQVLTALVLLQVPAGRMWSDLCVTDVPMRDYSQAEIDAYIATGDPFDKAGAYAIQNGDFRPVEKLAGCYANVVGLPLCHLVRTLVKAGLPPVEDVPAKCQAHHRYVCPVYPQVLDGIFEEKNGS